MNTIKAKLKFFPNRFEVIEEGDHVKCAVSGKNIPLNKLNYWNVELQEAYYSSVEAKIRYEQVKNKFISIYYVSRSIVLDRLILIFRKID